MRTWPHKAGDRYLRQAHLHRPEASLFPRAISGRSSALLWRHQSESLPSLASQVHRGMRTLKRRPGREARRAIGRRRQPVACELARCRWHQGGRGIAGHQRPVGAGACLWCAATDAALGRRRIGGGRVRGAVPTTVPVPAGTNKRRSTPSHLYPYCTHNGFCGYSSRRQFIKRLILRDFLVSAVGLEPTIP
jgi:hypothetical protein